jgi:hypothetical protein
MVNGRLTDRLAHRVASVMSARPYSRRALMARLRSVAMILGPDRVLTCDLSSWYKVSRSQCKDSIAHCPRTWRARSAGLARSGDGLATPRAATADRGCRPGR